MGVNVVADTISLENSTFRKQTFLLRENPGIYYLGLWDAVQIIWCNSFCSLKWLYGEFHKGNILLFPRHGIPARWEAVLLELPWQMYFSKLGFYTPPLHILLPKGHPGRALKCDSRKSEWTAMEDVCHRNNSETLISARFLCRWPHYLEQFN